MLIQQAENQEEHERFGLTPHEYYTRPFLSLFSYRVCAVIFAIILSSMIFACLPAAYATKYFLQIGNLSAWQVVNVHPAYFTKVCINVLRSCFFLESFVPPLPNLLSYGFQRKYFGFNSILRRAVR